MADDPQGTLSPAMLRLQQDEPQWMPSAATPMLQQDQAQALGAGDNDPFYDMRAALAAGEKPDASGHWPSRYKKPGSPERFPIVNGQAIDSLTGRPATSADYAENRAAGIRTIGTAEYAEREREIRERGGYSLGDAQSDDAQSAAMQRLNSDGDSAAMQRLHADAQADEPSMRVFETALTGARPGAGTAAAQLAPPTTGRKMAGVGNYLQSLTPNVFKEMSASGPMGSYNSPGPGLTPSLADIEAAAGRDPTVRAIYEEERAREPAPNPMAGPNRAMDAAQSTPGIGLPLGLIKAAMQRAGGGMVAPPTMQSQPDLATRVLNRLAAVNAGPEEQFKTEHPWAAATAQIPGETIRLAPALLAAHAAGGAGLLASAAAFDATSQAQAQNIGGQDAYEPGQGAVNIASLLSGGLSGRAYGNRLIARGAEEAVARRAAARVANTVMTAVPTAVQGVEGAVKKVSDNEPFQWNDLLVSLYKGVGEAALLSAAPEIAPGQRDIHMTESEALARERSAAIFGGDRALHDTLSKMEEVSKGTAPGGGDEAPDDHSNAVVAMQSAQDALLRAHASEAERRIGNDARNEAVERGVSPEATAEDKSLFDAIRVLERDMRAEPPDSAKRLFLGSEENTKRLADAMGVTDEDAIKTLRERAADLILEPHRKMGSQGGFARIRGEPETEEDRTARIERESARNREQQRVSAEAPEKLRQLVNRAFTRVTGREAPLFSRPDPGLQEHQSRSNVMFRDMATQERVARRAVHDLYEMAPPENRLTMDRIFTMAADDPKLQTVAMDNLPEGMREPFRKAMELYREVEVRHGTTGLELGALPQSIHEERGFTESGNILREEVVTPRGGKYEGKGQLVGGFDRYTGQWTHHDFGTGIRDVLPRWMGGRERTTNEYGRIQNAETPSSFRRREKSTQEWLEQGNVSIEPSFREMARQRQFFKIRSDLNYLKESRPDLYRTKGDFEGDIESQATKDRAHAKERLPESKKEFAQHKAWMVKNGVAIYAGEAGPLTKEMQEARDKISEKLHAQVEYMGKRRIPTFGMPEHFNMDDPQMKRRATEVRREQAKYKLLADQLWTHVNVERPETLFGVKGVFDQKTIDANQKLRELFDERIRLENQLSSKWVELKAKHGKEHAGNYVNSTALRDIQITHEAADTAPSIFVELSKTFRFMRVPANFIRAFAMQFTGNSFTTSMGGVHMTPAGFQEWMTGTQHVLQYLWSQGKSIPNDPIFKAMLDRGKITGALALYDVPQVLKEQVFSALEEAKREMKEGSAGDAARNYIAAALRAMRYYPGQLPIFGKGIQLVSAMDLIPQYSMIRQLVTGNGSVMGAMDIDQALTHSGYLFDMNAVPRWVDSIARNPKWYKPWPTFARWLYKGTVGPAQWMMASPPTLGTYILPGIKVPHPFERGIAEAEGSPESTKKVWMAKGINLAANALKLVAHIGVAANLSARLSGFDPNSDQFKRRKLAVAGGDFIRSLMLQTIGSKNGQPIFWDPTNLTPMTGPLTLGNAPDERNNDSAASRGIHWLVSLNWLTSAGTHILERKDFAGRDISFTQATLESLKNFVPGSVEMPATAAWNATRSYSRKTVGEALFQALSGATIRPSSPLDDETLRMRELQKKGAIEYIRNPIPLTPEGRMGLKMHGRNPAVRLQEMQRRMQRGE